MKGIYVCVNIMCHMFFNVTESSKFSYYKYALCLFMLEMKQRLYYQYCSRCCH